VTGKPVQIIGGDRLVATLDRFGDSLGDLSEPNQQLGEQLVSDARSGAPQLSGALRDSLMPELDELSVAVVSPLDYAYAKHVEQQLRQVRGA
jgi:hypothetical protein